MVGDILDTDGKLGWIGLGVDGLDGLLNCSSEDRCQQERKDGNAGNDTTDLTLTHTDPFLALCPMIGNVHNSLLHHPITRYDYDMVALSRQCIRNGSHRILGILAAKHTLTGDSADDSQPHRE